MQSLTFNFTDIPTPELKRRWRGWVHYYHSLDASKQARYYPYVLAYSIEYRHRKKELGL